jgi:hypothetical protein
MTLLEYCCRRRLGPPTHHEGDRPCWPCPQCGHRSWHVRPHKPPHKDRFSCSSCGWWGDEHDLLKHCDPAADYGVRLEQLARLRGGI